MTLARAAFAAGFISWISSSALAAENCVTSIIAYRLPECVEFFRRGGTNRPFGNGPEEARSAAQVSNWRMQVETDRITGVKTTAVWQSNRNGTVSPHRRPEARNVQSTILLICRGGNKREIVVRFDDQLVASHRQAVTYRIDDRQAVTSTRWQASTDSAAVGLWSASQVDAFFRSISNGTKILFRIEHDVFGSAETEFSLTGLARAAEPLRSACNWPAAPNPSR